MLTQNPGSVSGATRESLMSSPSGSRKYLNRHERRTYLRVISAEADPLRRAFMLTVFFTGCRISEALNLLVSRVDAAAEALTFETLKRRKPGCFRTVPIPTTLARLLQRLVSGQPSERRVWGFSRSTAFRMIKAAMKEANITGAMAMPKGLRHGLAVACLSVKIPLTTIQKWLGHARLETTAIYLDLLGEEEHALARRLWSLWDRFCALVNSLLGRKS